MLYGVYILLGVLGLGGRGWREAPDGCMAPIDWTPPTQ